MDVLIAPSPQPPDPEEIVCTLCGSITNQEPHADNCPNWWITDYQSPWDDDGYDYFFYMED